MRRVQRLTNQIRIDSGWLTIATMAIEEIIICIVQTVTCEISPASQTPISRIFFSPSRCENLSYITDRYEMYRTHENVRAQCFQLLHTYKSDVIFV